jgi:hypothetical protein
MKEGFISDSPASRNDVRSDGSVSVIPFVSRGVKGEKIKLRDGDMANECDNWTAAARATAGIRNMPPHDSVIRASEGLE